MHRRGLQPPSVAMTIPGELMQEIEKRVRDTVSATLGGAVDVRAMGATEDLFRAGMTSHQTVQVMLGVEYEFDIQFTDDDLLRSTFATIDSMVRAVCARTAVRGSTS